MEIRVLKYFLTVAREENITKAANLLHLTQPTLSRQLIQLEEELGVTLFQRSRHHIVLTEDGMLLRRRAEEILALAEKTKEDFRHNREQLSGTVAIGTGGRRKVFFYPHTDSRKIRRSNPGRFASGRKGKRLPRGFGLAAAHYA